MKVTSKICIYVSLMLVLSLAIGGCSQPETKENTSPTQSETKSNANPPEPGSLVDQSVKNFPDTGIINQFGERVSFETLPDKPVLMSFIYTRCPMPEMCPLITHKMRTVQKQLNEDDVSSHFVSVTFDPEYDTPAVLQTYGKQQDINFANWNFWTGSPETIDQLTKKFKILSKEEKTKDGRTVIMHNIRTYILNEDKIVKYWYRGSEWDPEKVTSKLKKLAEK